jgi:lambda family phage portal protein
MPSNKPARLNLVDRAVAALWPDRGVARLRQRILLAHYEAAKPNTQRRFRSTSGAPDTLVGVSAAALRNQVRYLERNHDIARGALATLVNNMVGPQGVGVEFQPRKRDGSIHTEYAAALTEAWRDWCRAPEVTRQHSWSSAQRLMARALLRDGEGLAQRLRGPVAGLDHGTTVPYSLELIEADLLPLDYDDESKGIRQGVERNAWGRATGYHVYRGHPEDPRFWKATLGTDTKRVPAANMLHIALRDRIGQLRGVSAFAAVITRLEDIKDYEESERVAAKVAAMLTGFVKRNAGPDGFDPTGLETDEDGAIKPRDLRMGPGMIIDTLAVGEEIGLLDPNRPNPNLVTFRDGQLRAMAAGLGASFSSLARNYNGTYSAQRQELVEQWVHYMVLTDVFATAMVRPVVEDFIQVADLSGVVRMPADLKLGTHDDVLFVAPSMPWIDPMREISAWELAVKAGFASEYEVLRKQGKNPSDLLAQVIDWRAKTKAAGLVFSSDAGALQQQAADLAVDTPPADGSQARGQGPDMRPVADAMNAGMTAMAAAVGAMKAPNVHVQSHAEADMPALIAALQQTMGGVAQAMASTMQQALAGAMQQALASMPAPQVRNDITVEPAAPAQVINQITVQPAEVKSVLELPARQTITDLQVNEQGDVVRTVATERTLP